MPNSFSTVLSSALVFSTCPPVSVWGTIYEEAISWKLSFCIHNPISEYKTQIPSLILWCRNINLLPIDYAFRPRLRDRLTLRRLPLHRNPWTFGEKVSHLLYRYSCQHSHFQYLHHSSQNSFNGLWNAPLPFIQKYEFASSVYHFSPVTFSAQKSLIRLVSYYAFFKG